MNPIQTTLLTKIDNFLNKIESEHTEVASNLNNEIKEIRDILGYYDVSFYKHDLSPYFMLRKDFKIKDDKVIPNGGQKRRTTRENSLRKFILVNALYYRFNLDRKQIQEVMNDSRANVIYLIRNYNDKMKYDPLTIKLQREFDELIECKYNKSNLIQFIKQ